VALPLAGPTAASDRRARPVVATGASTPSANL